MFCQTETKVHIFLDGQSSLILKILDDKAKQLEKNLKFIQSLSGNERKDDFFTVCGTNSKSRMANLH